MSASQWLPPNPWTTSLPDLEQLAQSLVGPSAEGWLRPAGHSVLIAYRKRGCVAAKLAEEFSELAAQVNTLRAAPTCDAGLRAAAFFHLRFENIHPLRDGNGRVGRTLLASQCSDTSGLPIQEVILQLEVHEKDYRQVYRAPNPEFQFELLVDLLARMLALPVTEHAGELPFPLEPHFLDSTPIPEARKLAAVQQP